MAILGGTPPATPSPTMRVVLMTVAMIHILLGTGEAYGWTALRPVLYNSGFFNTFSTKDQITKMNLVSTLGISANAMVKLPLGFILDHLGPRFTAVCGSVFFLIGTLMMGFGDKQSVTQIALAYFLIGTSGPFIQMPAFQFTNLFPKQKATLISLMITSFELSTGVFFIFNMANQHLGATHTQLFAMYALAGVFTLLTGAFLWPDSPHVEPHPEDPGLDGQIDDKGPEDEEDAEGAAVVVGNVPLSEQSFWRQISSWEFIYVTLFFSVHNFTQGVVLTTCGMQTTHYFPDEDTATMMANLFSIILPLGFLPMLFCTVTGISGFILSRPQLAFFVVSLMSCTYGALFLFPTIPAYITLFTIFPVARQFVFSTFISFSASTFGYKSFGVINGLASTFAGLAQLLQNFLVRMVVDESVPFTWEQMDVLMSLVPTILLIPPVVSWVMCCLKPADAPLTEEEAPLLQPSFSAGTHPTSVGVSYSGLSRSSASIPQFGSLTPSYGAFIGASFSGSHDPSAVRRRPSASVGRSSLEVPIEQSMG